MGVELVVEEIGTCRFEVWSPLPCHKYFVSDFGLEDWIRTPYTQIRNLGLEGLHSEFLRKWSIVLFGKTHLWFYTYLNSRTNIGRHSSVPLGVCELTVSVPLLIFS